MANYDQAYGTTGSDQIGDYRFYDLFRANQYPYQGIVAVSPIGHSNPLLAWEETKKFEVALDLGFFDNRIMVNGSFYSNHSSNQLLAYPLPPVTGFSSISRNFPAKIRNSGFEFSVSSNNVQSKNIEWSTSVNLTLPRNKLVSFPNIANTSYQYALIVGKPTTIFKSFHLVGVNDTTGVYEFADGNGKLTALPNVVTDAVVPVDLAPEFYGGSATHLDISD